MGGGGGDDNTNSSNHHHNTLDDDGASYHQFSPPLNLPPPRMVPTLTVDVTANYSSLFIVK